MKLGSGAAMIGVLTLLSLMLGAVALILLGVWQEHRHTSAWGRAGSNAPDSEGIHEPSE